MGTLIQNLSSSLFYGASSPENAFVVLHAFNTSSVSGSKPAIYAISSGSGVLVGIGTDSPQSTFDIKEVKDDAQGSKFFLRSARLTKGADPNDAAGTIQFIVDSGSYNDLTTSGSIASITTEVLSVTDEGAAGNLILKVATSEKIAPEEVFQLSARYDTDGHELTGKLQISNKLTVNNDISASGALTAGYLTASGLNYPDVDGLDRQVIKTDGLGNLSFGYAENVEITIKNVSGGTINKGTPCFITASGTSGNVAGVIPADAGDLTKMPAGVIAGETILDEAEGLGLVNGFIQGVNTSTFTSGDTVYVAVGGGYTNSKPTGSEALIQKLGNVEKADASNGSGVINGPGYYNDLPNWEEGKIQVGTPTYPVTSSVISLDETNKYVSGSESAKFQIGTYAFGYNTFPGFGFDITGSGIIVSSSLPSEHYPMVKIGETELLDLSTATALADHTFTIHNVDNFQVTSGSEPTDVSTNKLFEHTGNAFNVYTNGSTTKVIDASSTSVKFGATDLYLAPSSTTYVKATSTSTPQYIAGWDSAPTSPGVGAALTYVTSSTFTGGGGGGNVSNTGTPLNGQIAVWTDATTIEGTNTLLYNDSTNYFDINTRLDIDYSTNNSAVVDITNNNSVPQTSDHYALRVEGGQAVGTPGGQTKAYGGYFTAGNTNATNPDSIALYAQGHPDGAPNSYAAIFSGSTGGVVGINTMEPTVELEVSGDVKITGNLELGAIADVEERISSYRVALQSNCFLGQSTKVYLPFNSLSEQTGFSYIVLTPAAANGRLVSITIWTTSGGGSTVMGLHINSNPTAASTDTQTLSTGVPTTFTFSSGNTFSQNDELSFSIDPTSNPNGISAQIILEYDY